MQHFELLCTAVLAIVGFANAWQNAAANSLAMGDAMLSEQNLEKSIELYDEGVRLLPGLWSGKDGFEEQQKDDPHLPDAKEISVILSLHTNYATALSYLNGSTEHVLSAYRTACLCYRQWRKQTEESQTEKGDIPKDIKAIAAQSYFFLGMTYQDLASAEADTGQQREKLQHAVKSYAAAAKIDKNHWSSFANMAVVLADSGVDQSSGEKAVSLELYEESIMAYQKSIEILIGERGNDDGEDEGPTDPPGNVREVVSELHYRVGLCLVPFLFTSGNDDDGGDDSERQCTLHIGPKSTPTTRSCLELSAYQFNTALQFHPQHEGAFNALNIATADAIFGMSTDVKKVQNLFEDYAPTFEHSLVEELGYNGFSRMRKGFDRAMLSEGNGGKIFPLVLDAGCGTGLAGEVFRNISQTLVGVDLSPTIIDLAKKARPNLYEEFKAGDIKEILHQHALQKQHISLLVASDTFIYFNDLGALFEAIKVGLEVGGYAVISLENVSIENERRLNQLKPEWKWQLTPSGRVAHRKQYVEDIARANSLDTVFYETLDDFREEKGRGVRGHMYVLKKLSQGNDEL